MKKINLGDLFEFKTSKGLSYLQFIFKDDELGELVRILPGHYSDRTENIDDIVNCDEIYMVFFPVLAAFRKGFIEFVGNYNFSRDKPKYMRTKHVVRNEFLGWHIINTDTWKRRLVKELTPEQKQLSPWGIWDVAYLKKKIEEDWSLENWS